MLPQSPRSDLCWSPSLSRSSPESDAAILGRNSVDAWNETALRRRASLTEAETRVDKLPAYQGSSCSDACERGDRLVSVMEIELSLARSMARRLTAAAYHTPGLRLDLVKGEWLKAQGRRRPLQPRCRTFGCTLPDLHAGLHQVATPFRLCPLPPPPVKACATRTPLSQVASPLCKRRVVPRRWAGDLEVGSKKVATSVKRTAGSTRAA